MMTFFIVAGSFSLGALFGAVWHAMHVEDANEPGYEDL